jgi:type IV pilus biogenesis protein CpaD/CtpE
MKIDWYTKLVLTVIAATLLYICATRNAATTVRADSPQRVIVVRTEQPIPISAGVTVNGEYVPITWTNRMPVADRH